MRFRIQMNNKLQQSSRKFFTSFLVMIDDSSVEYPPPLNTSDTSAETPLNCKPFPFTPNTLIFLSSPCQSYIRFVCSPGSIKLWLLLWMSSAFILPSSRLGKIIPFAGRARFEAIPNAWRPVCHEIHSFAVKLQALSICANCNWNGSY